MKKIATLILITIFALGSSNLRAQKAKKTETIIIKTSSQCGMCKATIEKAMAYEKGIVSSSLNVETAELTVKYKTVKTTPEKIRIAISMTGYDADEIKANKKAYDNLPGCCQVGGMDH
jgi:mercuric ion binding protein